jgi:hypothetical protein
MQATARRAREDEGMEVEVLQATDEQLTNSATTAFWRKRFFIPSKNLSRRGEIV